MSQNISWQRHSAAAATKYSSLVNPSNPATRRALVIESGDQLSRRLLLTYILLLAAGTSLIPLTIDPFLPVFPEIAEFYGVPNASVQFTLTGVLVGFAVGQILAGPLSDAFGRRRPLLIALSIYLVAAMALFLAPNIETFAILRILMGVGAAASNVIAQAIVRDLFSGLPMMQMLARVYLLQSLVPVFAPILGSQLAEFLHWQQLFLVFGFFVLLVLLAANRFLVETLPPARRRSQTALGLARGYRAVLRDRIFVGLMIFGALQLLALFTYLNTVPFLFQDSYGISQTEFGLFFAFNALVSWAGVQIGARLPKIFPAQWLLAAYALIGALVGVGLFLTAGMGIWITEALFAIQLLCFGATITSHQTLALLNHGSEAGTAASLLGVSSFLFVSAMSPVIASLDTQSTGGIGLLVGLGYGGALLALMLIVRPWLVPDLRTSASA